MSDIKCDLLKNEEFVLSLLPSLLQQFYICSSIYVGCTLCWRPTDIISETPWWYRFLPSTHSFHLGWYVPRNIYVWNGRFEYYLNKTDSTKSRVGDGKFEARRCSSFATRFKKKSWPLIVRNYTLAFEKWWVSFSYVEVGGHLSVGNWSVRRNKTHAGSWITVLIYLLKDSISLVDCCSWISVLFTQRNFEVWRERRAGLPRRAMRIWRMPIMRVITCSSCILNLCLRSLLWKCWESLVFRRPKKRRGILKGRGIFVHWVGRQRGVSMNEGRGYIWKRPGLICWVKNPKTFFFRKEDNESREAFNHNSSRWWAGDWVLLKLRYRIFVLLVRDIV